MKVFAKCLAHKVLYNRTSFCNIVLYFIAWYSEIYDKCFIVHT